MAQAARDAFQQLEYLETGTACLTRDEVVTFARSFDPQPFHIDEEAARLTLLGGIAASGWHTCATVMELLEQAIASHSLRLEAGGTQEILWLQPVRPGDTLRARALFGPVSTFSCGGAARVASIETVNQRAEPVMRWRMDYILPGSSGAGRGDPLCCDLRRGRSSRVHRAPREHAIRAFDEVMPGDDIALGDFTFTRQRVDDFNARYGRGSDTAGDEVSPWHIPAAWMSCMVQYYEGEARWLAGAEQFVPRLGPAAGVKHLRWHAPVMVGDTLTFRGWAERKIVLATQKEWGLLVVGAEGVNQSGRHVVSFYPQMLLERNVVPANPPRAIPAGRLRAGGR